MKKISILLGALLIALSAMFLITCKKSSDDSTSTTKTPTCSDGIQNQGETGVDCGGPCGACPASVKTTINGSSWTATTSHITWTGNFLFGAGSASPADSIFCGFVSLLIGSNKTPTSALIKVGGTTYQSWNAGYKMGPSNFVVTDSSGGKMSGNFFFSIQTTAGTTVASVGSSGSPGTFSNVPYN